MSSFSFEFLTFGPALVKQLSEMEPAKRVMLATKHAMDAGVRLNEVQAASLSIGEVDSSLRFLLESIDLKSCEDICADSNVCVFNSSQLEL